MSNLKHVEKSKLENLFNMSSGYVLHFSTDRTFGDFFSEFEIDINSEKYKKNGSSKAYKLRTFWELESNQLVGNSILSMINLGNFEEDKKLLIEECKQIAHRLLSEEINLNNLKKMADTFNLPYMTKQIQRITSSINSDPDLAIGTSKELVETCCKTILKERKILFDERNDNLPKLIKLTLVELNLVPENIQDSAKGSKIIKGILSNISSALHGITELRSKYGTGHGKDGTAKGLNSRHARLAAGAATSIVSFIFETHQEKHK